MGEMEDFKEELQESFLRESEDLIENTERAFLELEKNKDNPEIINEIFRLAHNLKGTSRIVGFSDFADLAHLAEELIIKLKNKDLEITSEVVSILLEFNDRIRHMIKELSKDPEATFDNSEIHQKIQSCIDGTGLEDSPPPIEDRGEEEPSLIEQAPEESHFYNESYADESIRVNLSKIDKLNDVMGEIVILQTVLDQKKYSDIKDSLVNKSISQMGKILKEAQDLSMSLRMVPIKGLFQKMSRVIRDTSQRLNKKVDLKFFGEETEVDKTVLEHLSNPLVHIVTNAVDHGLESMEERTSLNKNSDGLIEIEAYHEGNNLVIQVTDDGRGIDPHHIEQLAKQKGLIHSKKSLTEEEILQYIFHPGFSTKSQASTVSGRGVGMDVVKKNIEKLSGEIKLYSTPNEGTCFKIILPLTLAIIEGVVTRVQKSKYILPLAQIQEFVHTTKKNTKFINGFGDCLDLRGNVIPIFSLEKTFRIHNPKDKENPLSIAVVVSQGRSTFSVKVDEIINQQQIVIKKVSKETTSQRGIMGSSILGDGRPAFIVDLVGLYSNEVKESSHLLNKTKSAAI